MIFFILLFAGLVVIALRIGRGNREIKAMHSLESERIRLSDPELYRKLQRTRLQEWLDRVFPGTNQWKVVTGAIVAVLAILTILSFVVDIPERAPTQPKQITTMTVERDAETRRQNEIALAKIPRQPPTQQPDSGSLETSDTTQWDQQDATPTPKKAGHHHASHHIEQ